MEDLDRAERDVVRAFEAGEFRQVRGIGATKGRYRQVAQQTLAKPRSINIRIGEADLARLKRLAAEQGIPYQTLISALLHQYSTKRTVSQRN
jgi:predicted DNA binding CopG/RHH family protein